MLTGRRSPGGVGGRSVSGAPIKSPGRAGRLAPLLALALLVQACGTAHAPKSPDENPLLADLVDYRNGLTLLREGRPDEAIQLFRRALQVHPKDANIPNALGLALVYKKDNAGAVEAFNDALKLDPTLLEAHNNRGVAYMEANKLDLAAADFQVVLDASSMPDKLNARYNLGLLEKKRGRWADAERDFTQLLNQDSEYRKAYRERGLVRVKTEDFRGALKDFLEALKDDPKDPVANYQAALCLLTTGRRDLAVRYMERTTSLAPDSDEGKRARRFLDAEPAEAVEEPK